LKKQSSFKNTTIINRLFPFFILLAISQSIFATGQVADKLFFEGKKYSLLSNPLEQYYKKNPEKKLPMVAYENGPLKYYPSCSALWRGYIATFELIGGRLYLTELKVLVPDADCSREDTMKSVLNEVFPNKEQRFADWYTGYLVIPTGKLISYDHMDYSSQFDEYLVIRIEAGIKTRATKMNADEFVAYRKAQFEAFKKTEQYISSMKKDLENPDNKNRSREYYETFYYRFFCGEYTSIIYEEQILNKN
jgi:hypothetical protein